MLDFVGHGQGAEINALCFFWTTHEGKAGP